MSNYATNPLNDLYRSSVASLRGALRNVFTQGTDAIDSAIAELEAVEARSNEAFPIPRKLRNIKDDLSDIASATSTGSAPGSQAATFISTWGPLEVQGRISPLNELIESASAGTLDIDSVPNIDAFYNTDTKNYEYIEKAQPSKLPGGNPIGEMAAAETPIDSSYLNQRESKTGIRLKQYNDATVEVYNRLRVGSTAPIGEMIRISKEIKNGLVPYDVDVINSFIREGNSIGYASLYGYVATFFREAGNINTTTLSRIQVQEIDNYTFDTSIRSGIKAVNELINEQVSYIQSNLFNDASQNPMDLLSEIRTRQQTRYDEYLLDGVPYIGKEQDYLVIYPFTYSDMVTGNSFSNPNRIFSQTLDSLMTNAIQDLERPLKLIAEFKRNERTSISKIEDFQAPPGWHYMNDGTLMPGDVHVDEVYVDIVNENTYVPQYMYDRATGAKYFAYTFDQYRTYLNLGFALDESAVTDRPSPFTGRDRNPPSFAQLGNDGNPIIPTPLPSPPPPSSGGGGSGSGY